MEKRKVSFWRIFWPSLVAGIVLIFLSVVFFFATISSLISKKPVYTVSDKAVLHLNLKGQIREMSKNDFDFNFNGVKIINDIGLMDILYGFEKAAKDDFVKGVFIELKSANCGYATAMEIRNAIKKFSEETGKFVVAYHSGEVVTLKEYYIASAATENYGFHSTNFEFLGLGTELVFFKGLFDKLDLEMQVIRGPNNDFKSAVEPFFLKEMSDSSRLQVQTFLDNIWSEIETAISEDRDIPIQKLEEIANNGMVRRNTQAAEFNFIDEVKYRDEVIQLLADKLELKEIKDLNLKSFEKYAKKKFEADQHIANIKKANVAVIIAEGEISVNGDGMASSKITKLIREAREDKNIKTIVLRINSPGGSALASDEIWREVKLANEEKKVVVSMGDVAASGGYYIAAPASKIFAQKPTVTGSIGVFGVIPYTGKMLENKLGLTFEKVTTNNHSLFTPNRKLTEEELEIIQEEVDVIYDDFLQRVAEGRGMSVQDVDKIARGRVWTGEDALRVGLVDTLGGIRDAINYAIKTAGIEKPIVRYYPKVKTDEWLEVLEAISESSGENNDVAMLKELMNTYKRIKEVQNIKGVQARLPYELVW